MSTNVSLKGPSPKGESGGSIALLDLPAQSVLSLDASASQTLKNEESLLVINNIDPSSGFHLLVVRGSGNLSSQNSNGIESLSIGILILFPSQKTNDDWFIVRKFDPRTEEISAQSIDELSYENLRKSVANRDIANNINSTRIISYHRFLNSCSYDRTHRISESFQNCHEVWDKYLTNFISIELLSKHGLTGKGDKIIPGAFSQDDDYIDRKHTNVKMKTDEDGHSMVYPPVPHFGVNQSRSINSHAGTRRFLANLSPVERTSFFLKSNRRGTSSENIDEFIFEKVLCTYYDGCWKKILGQFQLSFSIFLCCSCLSSLEHWRDTIQMLAMVSPNTLVSHSQLFEHLLVILKYQLFSFDNDIFNDQEIMDGNFLFPAIKRLCFQCKNQTQNKNLERNAIALLEHFKSYFSTFTIGVDIEENRIDEGSEMDDDEGDEDGPIVVPFDEIEASIQRSSQIPLFLGLKDDDKKSTHACKYPFLYASMMEDEDILMACARILDEKSNVTAVREAAAYLEEVEAKTSYNQTT